MMILAMIEIISVHSALPMRPVALSGLSLLLFHQSFLLAVFNRILPLHDPSRVLPFQIYYYVRNCRATNI